MKRHLSIISCFVCMILSSTSGHAQTLFADSCGVDSNPTLNRHEILFIDSFLFHRYTTKKTGVIDPKKGFEFPSKKMAFYSCTINSNTKGKGIIPKQEFFDLIKPGPEGHAGIGLIRFTEAEKAENGGFDAMIIIDCPYNIPSMKDLTAKLRQFNKQ